MIALSFYRPYIRHSCFNMSLFFLIAPGLAACAAWAQTSNALLVSSRARIVQDQDRIRVGEQKHLSEQERGALWAQLALDYEAATEFPKAEDAYNRSLQLLKNEPSAQAEYASTLDSLASLYMIYGRLDDAESARKHALAARRKMGNTSEVGLSQIHLADIALAQHRFKKAERLALQGMQGMRSSVDSFRTGMLSAWITLAYARCLEGHNAEGLMSAEQAVAFAVRNFESESAAVGFALETLGFAQWKTGAAKDAEKTMLQGLRILRTNLAPADPRLAGAMLQYRAYLAGTNRVVEAEQIQQQVTRMNGESGIFCAGCAVSVSSLSKTLR